MSSRIGHSSNLKRSSIVGALAFVIVVPMFAFAFTGSFQKADALSNSYTIFDHFSCVNVPLISGTATFNNKVCELPVGAKMQLAGGGQIGYLTIDKSVKLLNKGTIAISWSSKFIDLGKIENLGTINLERGSVMIVYPNATFTQNGLVNVDSTSGIVNHGTIAGSGITNNGTFYNHCTGAITLGPIAGNQPIDVCGNTTGTIVDATNQATGQSMYAGGRTFYGEWFTDGTSAAFKTVDCATVELRKHGSPTGTAVIAFSAINGEVLKAFGTIDVSTLKTGYKQYEFCLPSTDEGHLIQPDQILAVRYSGGDPLNRIDVRRSNVGFGPDYEGGFHIQQGTPGFPGLGLYFDRDLLFKLTNS